MSPLPRDTFFFKPQEKKNHPCVMQFDSLCQTRRFFATATTTYMALYRTGFASREVSKRLGMSTYIVIWDDYAKAYGIQMVPNAHLFVFPVMHIL